MIAFSNEEAEGAVPLALAKVVCELASSRARRLFLSGVDVAVDDKDEDDRDKAERDDEETVLEGGNPSERRSRSREYMRPSSTSIAAG